MRVKKSFRFLEEAREPYLGIPYTFGLQVQVVCVRVVESSLELSDTLY
jgi:hypothetical protein